MNYPAFKRWLYHDQHPTWLARSLNAFWRAVHSSGIISDSMATLEVIGRKSGKIISFPVMVAHVDGKRYLVSMLGDNAQWVLNVRAAHGKAFLRAGKHTEIQLDELPADQRAPILKAYLQIAPGARPHIPVNKAAPLAEFEKIAGDFPVFLIASSKDA